jgi:hypothetical protein
MPVDADGAAGDLNGTAPTLPAHNSVPATSMVKTTLPGVGSNRSIAPLGILANRRRICAPAPRMNPVALILPPFPSLDAMSRPDAGQYVTFSVYGVVLSKPDSV